MAFIGLSLNGAGIDTSGDLGVVMRGLEEEPLVEDLIVGFESAFLTRLFIHKAERVRRGRGPGSRNLSTRATIARSLLSLVGAAIARPLLSLVGVASVSRWSCDLGLGAFSWATLVERFQWFRV
ncbi:photosystem I reaction center subunit XI [Striga asiatica]|uniref:Photosystem I reaction center subunit XI n=1 Tax=Striga asiatica TaxID=4170 RepID=A0A5A7RBU5_STRAF|nr:photosystem I reaction center subunit XI [Striga asiatica]